MPQISQKYPEHKLTETELRQKTQGVRLRLFEYAANHTLNDLLTKTLDEVELLTGSRIGFYHFLLPDQEMLSLQTWSTQTREKFCQAEGEGLHYPVSEAGVWVDAVHRKEPVIHNNYAALPHKKGLTEGHAKVTRELVVPVIRDDKVVAILGVGNKPTDYIDQDMEIVSYLADVTWEIAEKKRAEEALLESREKLRVTLNSIGDAVIATDTAGCITGINPVAAALTGWPIAEAEGQPLEMVFKIVDAQTGQPVVNPVKRALESGLIMGLANHTKLIARHGAEYQIADSAAPIKDEAGNITGVVLVFRDVTEAYRMQESLQESEKRFRSMVEGAPDPIFIQTGLKFAYLNRAACRLFGIASPEELLHTPVMERVHPDYHAVIRERIRRLNEDHQSVRNPLEQKYIRVDGREVWVETTGEPILYQGQNGALVFARDISQHKEAERKLRDSAEQHRNLFNSIRDAILVADTNRQIVHCNPAFSELFGYKVAEIIGRETSYIYRDLAEFETMGQKIRENMDNPNFLLTVSYKKKNGDIFPGETNVFYLRNSWGEIEGFIGMIRDITERKQAEKALRQSESNLRLLLAASQAITADFNLEAVLQSATEKAAQAVNPGSSALYLLKDESLHLAATAPSLLANFPERFKAVPLGEHPHIAKALTEQTPVVIEDTAAANLTPAEREIVNARGLRSILYLPLLTGDKAIGVLILGDVNRLRRFTPDEIELYRGFAGQVAKTIENVRLYESLNQYTVELETTIKERRQAEESLKTSEAKFRNLFQNHAAVKLIINPDTGRIVEANRAAEKFYGRPAAQLQQMRIQQINTLSPEQIQVEMEKARTEQRIHFKFRHRLADGSIRDVEVFSSPINISGQTLLHFIIHDITDHRKLEEQLRQAQKMESVGRLAGGVAHDFNNMLGVILGYGELLLNKLHPADPMRREVERIVEAGTRSAALTRQLLAFSRKQTLQPEYLNLNTLIRDFEKMLQRLIGEDIELEFLPAEDLSRVMADPGQIEQVIMNLAVNARDAMPYGGKLTIETANVELDETYIRTHAEVEPGPYVQLAITDTGCGMDKETLSNLFEPFFTTKEQGKGTGLGLATVYGIVKQSGGHIWVYSEIDQGTTFKIYLPQAAARQADKKRAPTGQEQRGSGEHILVVEDEDAVRELLENMLTALGYRVTLAANGGEALLLVEEKGLKPDLVVTDVVMPQMSGRVLIDRLRRTHPDLKALFMSGYTDNAIVHHGVLDPNTPFIQKPFRIKDIAAKVQAVLRAGP